MKKINKNKISIVGLGKLGLPLAVCFIERGFKIIGVDVNERVVNLVNKGKTPFFEPKLQELLSKVKNKLKVTQNHQEVINQTDITFIIVATPSDPNGNFSNKYVESALKSLAKAFKKSKKNYHLFVISSTVMPTSIEKRLIPLIEKYSGKKVNLDFGVCYIPDFVALGNVIDDFLNPDLVIIGESNKFAGDQLNFIYKKFCKNQPHIARMSIISAEIAKVSLNNYLVMKMNFANYLANICEKIPGADVDLITRAIGADKRIAPYCLKGGLSVGGTCFPRDTKAFITFAKKYGYGAEPIKVMEKINDFQNKHLADIVFKNLAPLKNKKVSILGLAFKPNSPEITESPAIKLIHKLLKKRISVAVYDPLAGENTKKIFGEKIEYKKSVKDCLSFSCFWVITTPDKKFKKIDGGFIKKNHTTIIDCWRILDPNKFSKKVKYIKWGYYQKD